MMGLTSKTSKSFLLFKRALVLLCFVLCSLMANASSPWYANYKVNVNGNIISTGQGTIYLSANVLVNDQEGSDVDDSKGVISKSISPVTATYTGSLTLDYAQTVATAGWNNYYRTKTNYENITLKAEAAPGSEFVKWANDDASTNPRVIKDLAVFSCTSRGRTPETQTHPTTFIPIFKAKTYHYYTPNVMAIYQNDEGEYTTGGGHVYVLRNGELANRPGDESADWVQFVTTTKIEEQGDGQIDGITFTHTLYAKPMQDYVLQGWYEIPDPSNLPDDLSTLGNPLSTEEVYYCRKTTNISPENDNLDDLEAPKNIVAVFRKSLLYHYYGASVYVSDNEPDGGLVYVDKGEAGDAANVTTWVTEKEDNTKYEVRDQPDLSFTYYAKENDKYAFKGWATSPYSEPIYGNNPVAYTYQHTYTMLEENAREDNPYYTPALYAVFESYYYKAPPASLASNSQDAGYVYVSLTDEEMPADWVEDVVTVGTELHQVAASAAEYSYTVHYRARAKAGNTFYGWSTTTDGLNIVSQNAHYEVSYNTSAKNSDYPHVAAPLYAVFKSDIDIRQQDRMIVYVDDEGNGNINDAKILIDFQKGNTLTATLHIDDRTDFTLSNRSGSKMGNVITFDATQGLIELVLSYKGELATAVGKTANIALTATSAGQPITRNIAITVEEAPIITFLPTDGKGTYTVKMTNGSGINYTVDPAKRENTKVPITHESMSNLEMNLTDDIDTDEFYFFGWQMIDGNTVSYISYDELCNYQFTKSVKVRAEFIPKNRATYFLMYEKDNPNRRLYHDLQEALDDAQELHLTVGGNQTVVFNDYHGTTRVTEGVLPKGNYTIHQGVTLLIPGDADYTSKDQLTADDYDSHSTAAAHYIKWIVEDGTNISVKGTLSIYSRLQIDGQKWVGRPWQYGWIELGENCHITLEAEVASALYAYGYITGPLTSSVTAKEGATVKEAFQLLDWHGGTETSNYFNIIGSIIGNIAPQSQKVFPSSQFYIQNVEVPLTFESGSSEYLTAGVDIGSLTIVEVPFIGNNTGMIRLADGIKVTKYYDKYTDSNVYIFEGDGTDNVAKLGNVVLDNVLMGKGVNSADFVLAMPHNYDFRLKNVKLSVLYDLAFLAGTKVHVDENSEVIINGTSGSPVSVFLYDEAQNGNYFGTGNLPLIPVGARPGGLLYSRTAANLQDAKWVIDGKVSCGQYGHIYTTNTSSERANCANITSNGGGQIVFGSQLGTKTLTYQRKMGEWVNISVTPARMRNADGSYTHPEASQTFTYRENSWRKEATDVTPTTPTVVDYIPKFSVTETNTFTAYVGDTDQQTLTPSYNNNAVDWTSVTWELGITGQDADQFSLGGTGASGQVIFTPKSDGTKTATLRITATYSHNADADNTEVLYTYTKDVFLVGNALYLQENTLKFAELDNVYYNEGEVSPIYKLFDETVGTDNANNITITCSPTTEIIRVSGNSVNNAQFRTFATGEVIITAEQDADLTNHVAATRITKKLIVHDRVVWNWSNLYFNTENTNPVTVLDGSPGWKLTKTSDPKNIINFQGEGPGSYTASIEDQIAGYYTVGFEFNFEGDETKKPFTSKVYANPQHLRVDVNVDTVFNAITLSTNDKVEFLNAQKMVRFSSTQQNISQWKLTFIGVPDKIYFTPTGDNTWQIEESANGTNWTTSMPWKLLEENVDFSMSLLPSTRYLRISYGAGVSDPEDEVAYGTMKELYITELSDVKADVEKLYMPIKYDDADNVIPVTKEVVLTYANVSKLRVGTTNPVTSTNPNGLSLRIAGTTDTPSDVLEINPDSQFGITGIEVISNMTEESVEYLNVYNNNSLVFQIPIHTYFFPQELPIKLATDKPDGGDRFYYVTTHTHNVEWDGTDGIRTITLNNATSDAAPYIIFEFTGAPTYIGFNHTTIKGDWEIEEYTDTWRLTTHQTTDIYDKENGIIKRTISPAATAIRVTYQSPYAEKINMTDLVIVGDASVVVDPARLELYDNRPEQFTASIVNLSNMTITSDNANFKVSQSENGTYLQTLPLTSADNAILNGSSMGNIPIYVQWSGTDAIEYGTLTITATVDGETKVLATVELIGIKGAITDGALNIFTGVPDGDGYTLDGEWEGEEHREVNIRAAFSNATPSVPLFDYVVVYGETTTSDGTTTITRPNTMSGSNAKTPCYIYQKNSEGTAYQFLKRVENTNVKEKAWDMGAGDPDAVTIPDGKTSVSMYINGFCPYASTGYTKADEGVWYFRANGEQSVDIYLDSCYIYSRAKTDDGHFFIDRQDGYSFVEPYACGSGAVLVFACNEKANSKPMNVTIHTLNHNMLKSHYGCFLQSIAGRAFQASSPVQIRVIDDTYVRATRTTLNFTDEWPASKHPKTGNGIRTNGFLSLQKQVNNAPSIDMGAPNTIVNFNGGQVELQNAQIVSTNYVSSMAICHRSGKFAGILLAYGMGTDAVEGTVNFNDGTTTVLPMYVSPNFAESYLLDKNAEGNYITNSKGEYLTTCLRTPANTYVTGGSHCMMRACTDPTTSGGAPRNLPATDANSKFLGLYKYPKSQVGESVNYGWTDNGTNGLVTPSKLPTGYTAVSVTPNNNGTDDTNDDYLNFWFDPEFESSVTPEVEKPISFWKTCMTEITAEYAGYGGSAGGSTSVSMNGTTQTEIIKNLMYCKIDNNILEVIRGENYQAPVKNPAPEGGNYLPVHPSSVQQATENYITNQHPYQVEEKIYYITTATADVWNAFTAPFDVANIYIMETYPEKFLKDMEGDVLEDGTEVGRTQIMKEQAKHNADFAAFFAVTVALGQQKTFETIYQEYITWANLQDANLGLTTQSGYTPRGMQALVPFDSTNWATADFYLNENNGNWEYTGDPGKEFTTSWTTPDASDGILLHKGRTYSMLLPFCTKCGEDITTRTFWDYWSGKFLIFESTAGPHIVDGSAAMADVVSSADSLDLEVNGAQLSGNRTFSQLSTKHANIYNYVGNLQHSTFSASKVETAVKPTESFLLANIPTRNGMRPRGVTTSGEIIYDTNSDDNGNQTPTGNLPTVSGGNDLFITSIAGGINIAVAAPQHVRVLSSTGAVLFQGMVQTAVDVLLPTNGVYVITGENEVHKILH